MNKITIRREKGRELGQYAPEEIKGLVMTGELVATDSVLHAPTGEWKPLASISEFGPFFSDSQGDAGSSGATPGSESDSSLTAEEEELIEQIKQWKWRKKKRGVTMIMWGVILLVFAFTFTIGFLEITTTLGILLAGAPGLLLLILGIVTSAAAATGLPPGMTPPPGYTTHTSSYYGGGCSSCGSGGGGDGGGGDGGGCGGGD